MQVLVARGSEAGGHGTPAVSTLPLLAAVLDRVDVPVLAAGGIASGRALAAVLAAGAEKDPDLRGLLHPPLFAELMLARRIGLNTVRVFLHDQLWAQDRNGFQRRLAQFVAVAARRPRAVRRGGVTASKPGRSGRSRPLSL